MHRAFFLNALHRAVLNFEVGFTPETITKSTSDTNPVIEYSHGPCSELRAELELRQTKMSVLRIETGDGGPKAFLHTTDEFQRFAHAGVPLFGGPRYLRYIRELCDSVSLGDVVGSEPEDGSQLIERRIRLAIFEVARWAGKTCVTALNVHAKTESRATAGEEVEEMRQRENRFAGNPGPFQTHNGIAVPSKAVGVERGLISRKKLICALREFILRIFAFATRLLGHLGRVRAFKHPRTPIAISAIGSTGDKKLNPKREED
ncbi:hypothetical protein FA13DRAFT_1709990 [Coprinellus micaceus]|uniref:Uncharacterized protein n=1 Tax=Coprinellus micaceus TaxID=71717 RepID=A0A4Y7TAK1_COPMI|nr:hypothetical protein FA13DRAFT_1709990 [Coprinellus micaceus]